MSTRYNNGSHYENHQRAAELEKLPTHAHSAAGEHGQEEHLTGNEHTREAHEHSPAAHEHSSVATVGHGIVAFGHKEIADLAFQIWQAKGSPEGTAEADWHEAAKELRSRAHTN
jgi:hypothetical protein